MLKCKLRQRALNWLRYSRLRTVGSDMRLLSLARVRKEGDGLLSRRVAPAPALSYLSLRSRAHKRCRQSGRKRGLRLGLSRFGWNLGAKNGFSNLLGVCRW